MAAQLAQTLVCPEAEQEVRDFIAQAEAVLGAEAQASPASLSALASTAKSLAWRPGLWANTDKAAAKSTIAELLSRPAFKRALLLVTNEATRWTWSPHQRSLEEQQGLKAKIEALEAVVLLCGCLLGSSNPAAPVLDFARRLVLSQTLEALSGRLADARAELEFVADWAAAAAAAVGVGPFLQADAPALLMLLVPMMDLVGAAAHLMRGCLQLAIREPDAGPEPQSAAAAAASGAAPEPSAPAQPAGAAASGSSAPSGAAVAEAAAASLCYAQELAAALRASAVAEHTCAALASVFRLWAVFDGAAKEEPPRADPAFVDVLCGHADRTIRYAMWALTTLEGAHVETRPASLARAAARGPGAFYTSLACGVAVLSAMDGEDTYGLAPSVRQGFNEVLRNEVVQRAAVLFGAGVQSPELGSLGPLMTLLNLLPADEGKLLDPAKARAMLPRSKVLPLAMRMARVWVLAAAEAAAGRTREEELAVLTDRRLGTGRVRALLDWGEAALLASAALQAASTAVRSGAGPEVSVDLGEEWWRLTVALAMHLQAPTTPLPHTLPPAPPPGLESALAGGVLPCLENLFRRTAASLRVESPPQLEALHAFAGDGLWQRLAPLLAWGDARQAAALLRTIGKGLEAAASLYSFYSYPADQAPAAERQLLAMLAAAVANWLPPLCRLLWARYRDQAGFTGSAPLITCLCWLPLLVRIDARHGPPTRPSAVLAAGPAAAGAAAGASASGSGWATGLSPVRFVGMALQGINEQSEETYLRYVAQACCAVAAALPEEVTKGGGEGPAWEPQQLRSLGAECRARGYMAEAEAVEALAAQLVRWVHGSGPRGGRGGARASAASGAQALAARFGAWFPGLEAAAALLPASPAAARARLGGCSNPTCANLEGDSDAALPASAGVRGLRRRCVLLQPRVPDGALAVGPPGGVPEPRRQLAEGRVVP
ncbi:hypothetical protein HYH03_017880 [Edaphochlamys debaryana]|uniref:Uncharacterized protein n=1 Tax=Edaphochlamys debaryana TaxID=47281 RepID=A0A836BQ38_9CHLO|nr:hypothetical protein HYH03_017880 [Edaphochlamys debaryana]|eukprot:KAG2483223.1 hypothetical protein HYH03_017880 [Edaphochlamys debaryana]